jgi:hypothetical protein
VAARRTPNGASNKAEGGERTAPPRLRLRLATIDDVKAELARLYRSAKAKQMDVGDASKLANMLALLGRLIEGADLERRIAAIEAAQTSDKERPRCH